MPTAPRRISLSLLVAMTFVSQIVIAVGLTGYLCFRNGEKAVSKLATQLRGEITYRIIDRLDSYLKVPHQINQINATAIRLKQLNPHNKVELEQQFWELLKLFDTIDNIAFGSVDGEFTAVQYNQQDRIVLQVSGVETAGRMTTYELDFKGERLRKRKVLDAFDPRQRAWYKTTLTAEQPIWNPIFDFFSDRQILVLSASQPLYTAENRLLGVLTTRLYLSRISLFLETLEAGKSGEIFIIERDGKLVASSVDEDIFLSRDRTQKRINATEVEHSLVRATAIYLEDKFNSDLSQINEPQYLDFKFENKRQFLQVTPFKAEKGIDWLVVVVVPETDFMAEINANTRLTLMLCAIALIVATIISIVTTRRLVNPILQLMNAVDALSQGKWHQRVQNSSIKELSLLAIAFNRMAEQLQNSFRTLEEAEAKYRDIFENAIDGIFQSTPKGQFLRVNPALAAILGYASPEALVTAVNDISTQIYVNPQDREKFQKIIEANHVINNFQVQVYRADGQIVWISEHARVKRDREGKIIYYEGTVEDITKSKLIEAQLQYNAYHDDLTGLLNRTAFLKQLQSAIARAKLNPETRFAVLFFDLDDFKVVNDSLGHLMGDRLLIAVVERIQSLLPEPSVFARFGGDEFILLLECIDRFEDAIAIARQINLALQSPFKLNSHEVFTNSSIGIVFSHNLNQKPDDFLRDADTALYQAKAKGKGRYELFNREMHAKIRRRLQLETDLRHAVEREELKIVYQPIIDTINPKIVGVEALARWYHPQQGWIAPDEFIPLAEETGSIVPLGWWLVQAVCQQWQIWQNQCIRDRDFFISINWSSKQLFQVDLVRQIEVILKQNNCPPSMLKMEITESGLLHNTEVTLSQLNKLVSLGIQLSIDDFGTGYSSLSYLYKFPFNTLKIDRSFINNLNLSSQNREIVEAIVRLAHHLNLIVVAEGVETQIQLDTLRQLGCEQVQGYIFSPPIVAEEISQLLLRRDR
jgi:diguanylate cyclase (GGDEF)-like protein/PAS domain S-box-containing protein